MRFLRASLLSLIAVSAVAVSTPAFSQNTTTITATTILSGGAALSSGTLCLTGTDVNGNNITFTTHGGGLNLAGRAFCQTVTSGALAGSLTVPNPALTLPANICYHAKVSDAGNNQTIDLGITCTIAGSSFSFDTALLGGAPSTFPSTALQVAPSTPANSSAACTAGQIWVDATYVYVCTATNTIKRAALSSF
jgi:hypothetical protein